MIHGLEDLVIGSAALALGVLLIAAAARNWSWCYNLHTSRWLESLFSRNGVRVLHGLLGLGLIALGLAIAQGWRWQLWH
ncbi:MAG: Imm17 family immunity protein [Pirellulaceae bacterium]